jgi:hypothetical protein
MSYEVKQSWKIVIPVDANELDYLSSNHLFKCLTGNNFVRSIGGIEKIGFQPIILQPTLAFHTALAKHIESIGFSGKRFPYDFGDNSVNVNIHYYLERYIVLTVNVHKAVSCSVQEIPSAQDLSKQENLNKFILLLSGLVQSGKTKSFSALTSIKSYPCTRIFESTEGCTLSDSQAVELLTRHSGANDNIVQNVMSKNLNHQVNASRVLVDKQGLLQVVPFNLRNDAETKKKFKSVASLLELAIVISKSLNDKQLIGHESYTKEIKHLISNSDLVIQHSVTAKNTFDLLTDEFKLERLLSTLESEKPVETTVETKQTFKEKLVEFYGSKEFFATLLAALLALLMLFINIGK